MLHQVSNQLLWTSRLCCCKISLAVSRCQFPHISLTNLAIFKSCEDKGTRANCRYHKAVYRPLHQALLRLWCAGIQTFMAAGGHATLAIPGVRAPSTTASVLACKSMCVTDPTMNLLFCSCRFRSASRDEQAHRGSLGFTCAGEDSSLKSACKLTCLFGLLTPMSDVRPRHPHIKGNGVVGELISVLEKILTFGICLVLPRDLLP